MADYFQPKNKATDLPQISSAETSQQFQAKMKDLDIQAGEKQTQAQAILAGVDYVNLHGFPISPETLTLIPEAVSKNLQTISFYWDNNDIRLGTTNPFDKQFEQLIQDIKTKHHAKVKIYQISQTSFDLAVKLYDNIPKIKPTVRGVEINQDEIKKFEREVQTFSDLAKKLKSVSVTDLLTLVIAAAIKARASDIHFEAEQQQVKIRFRIDGLLHEAASLENNLWSQVLNRIKLISRLKINVAARPQDGNFTIFLDNETIDVRVSTLPTTFGESVVIRILMSSQESTGLESLGLRGRQFELLKLEIEKPNGMIITTGPTGSGKTTTLYAILNRLNNPDTKIITIEDPIEYKLSGVNQSQVDQTSGYTFATGLRSIVRQDPDVIMVGEIRDLETAEIAINAALTGHLVLSSLHTNDAAGTVPRLLAMNVKAFLLAPAINAMVGQRLVRRICPKCKKEQELDSQTASRVIKVLAEIPTESGAKISEAELKKLKFYRGQGCEECQGLGYKGRVGIFEIMVMNKQVESLILSSQVSEYDMRDIAAKNGMITMIQDGLLKAADGITTVEEVFRVAKDITTIL